MKQRLFFYSALQRGHQKPFILLLLSTVLASCISNENNENWQNSSLTSQEVIFGDNVSRDERIIGVWEKVSYNRTGVHNEKRVAFYRDGTMAVFTRTYGVTSDQGASFSFDNGWVKNQQLQAYINDGMRWFTRGGMVLTKPINGPEVLAFYYEIESYNGKSNLFTMNSPNQKKPTEMFRKIR